jgi:RES domain
VLAVPISGEFLRVADADWVDPLDATFAAQPPGQRWNPPGVQCLCFNRDHATARANVARLYEGKPYGPEDLDPATAPVLIEVAIPDGVAADAYSPAGLADLGLPVSYPLDAAGLTIAHAVCQPLGQGALDAGLDGVDAKSAAVGGDRELAWFPKGRTLTSEPAVPFDEWWYA